MTDGNNYAKGPGFGPKFLQRLANANLANWQAINELIANSIDSWIDFSGTRPVLEINIIIEQSTDLDKAVIVVTDNANGMNLETLQKAVRGFLDSDKEESKNSKKYLGMFGFGLLGAAFTLGQELTVVTTTDNKKHYVATGGVEKFKTDKDFDVLEKTPSTQEKKLFKKSGTRVVIKDFNGKIDLNDTRRYLQHSWRYFLNKNDFGSGVKITLEFNGEKETMLAYKLGQFNDRPVIDETLIPIEFDLEWKERRGENKKIKISGNLGLSVQGGQNALAGGLNLYRRGQLIEHTNREFYNWGAEYAKIHGDLHIDLPVTMQKNGYDKQSDAWKALMEKYGPDSGFWAQYTKWSNRFRSSISENPEEEEYKKFIAEYKDNFNLKLSKAEQGLLSKGGVIDSSNSDKKQDVNEEPKPEEEIEEQVNFKIKDLENFQINKERYIISKTVIDDAERGPWFLMPVGNKLNVGINSSSEIASTLNDAFKKVDKQQFANLLVKSIYLDCIKQFLKSEDFEPDFIAEFSNQYMEY